MTSGVDNNTGRSFRFIDRIGTRNGRLTFIEFAGVSKNNKTAWTALCDCGNKTTTDRPRETRSCGCIQREMASENMKKRKLNPEEKKKRVSESSRRQREKIKKDPIKSMHARLSRLHRHAISQISAIKTSPTFESLGYTAEDFRDHIERQFTIGMSWGNMKDWQIDHIIPISTAETMDDVIRLNQLSNLRPMWSSDNNKKRAKIESLL